MWYSCHSWYSSLMSTRRFSIFSRLQICFPRHRRRTWIAGSLSTASLYTNRHTQIFREIAALKTEHRTSLHRCLGLLVCLCETLRFALRLSDGICRVTLYSVCRSSSSAMKQASCTRRFALTICSLSRRRLLTNTASLRDGGSGNEIGTRRRIYMEKVFNLHS